MDLDFETVKKENGVLFTEGEEHTWKVLDSYFKTYGFVNHQIESYNDFVTHGIQRIIDEEPSITITPKKGQKYTVAFGQIEVGHPSIIEEDRSLQKIYPSNVRNRDLTYEGSVYVDIYETLTENDEVIDHHHHRRISIAYLPIMINSVKCNLNDKSHSEKIKLGECSKDPGGYFIINGKERVIVAQLRANYNRVQVLKQKNNSNNKYKYIAEIRSMSEETGHSVLIQTKIGLDNRSIVFSLPYIQQQIPVGIVFKALGYCEDEEILKVIDLQAAKGKKYLDYILRDSYFIQTREEALEYIGKYSMHTIIKEKRVAYATQVVETELFPHLGITSPVKEKALNLGYMVNKLLMTCIGLRECHDRDNISNKRVEIVGALIYDLFRTLFKRYVNTIKLQLQRRADIMTIIPRLNIISKGLKSSFSTGNWGVQKNAYIRTGVSQVLSRLTYIATLSHLRRMLIQVGKEGKDAKIRQLHPSQIFFVDPAETPEGQTAGIVTNFALLCRVTKRIPTVLIRDIVEKSEYLILIKDVELGGIKVFLNGIWLGTTEEPDELVDEFKLYRNGIMIDNDVSITYDDMEEEIRIFSDEGRFIRPVFNVVKNKLTFSKEDGTDWDSLVKNNKIHYLDSNEIESSVIAMSVKELENDHSYDYCEIHPSMMLGICANTIPFPDHSQAPRNCYYSSMSKQAMGIFAESYQIRSDTISHVLEYPQRPIVSTKPSEMMGIHNMPNGINAIVAILCHRGFNQEDSVLVNRSAIDMGLFRSISYRCLTDQEKKKGTYSIENIELPALDIRKRGNNYNKLDHEGIVKIGIRVEKDDVIIGKVLTKTDKNGKEERRDISVSIKNGEDGVVDRVYVSVTPDGYRMVKVIVRNYRIPEIGDKLTSRAGQKGTIGMIYSPEDMPFTSDGIIPDIIMNAHAIPSRMTINQLMECVLGKSSIINGVYGDATPWTTNSVKISEELCNRLGEVGFERHGWETLYSGTTGEALKAKVFIGPTYYQRLKHMVKDKLHSRSQGHVTMLTRQPLEGRSREGGLRFGKHFAKKWYRKILLVCDIAGNISKLREGLQTYVLKRIIS